MIEKALAAAIEPVIDDLVRLERRLSSVATEVEAVKNAEPVEVDIAAVKDTLAAEMKSLADAERALQLEEVDRILFS